MEMTNIEKQLDLLNINRRGLNAKVVKKCLVKSDREMFLEALQMPQDNRVNLEGCFIAVAEMAGCTSNGIAYLDMLDGVQDIETEYVGNAEDFGKMNVSSGTVADCIAAVRASGKFQEGVY